MSTPEGPKFNEAQLEKEKTLDLNVASLNYCKTVDEMVGRIEEARKEGRIDSVLLGEYDFKVEEVLSELEKIRESARQNESEIILAPDNQFGRNITWGQLKTELQEHGVNVEETQMPDEHKPETIGMFVSRVGVVYAFPKTWHLKQVHRPVHKIPDTNIGITICGEIGHIKPADLDGVNVLYNPSREGDDPYLKFRMLHRHDDKPLTRERVVSILMEDNYYKSLLDDSKYNPNDPEYMLEYDTREQREKKFNEAVESHLAHATDPKNSMYVKEIDEALRERNIPVVRTDGERSTGVLNQLPNTKISELDYREGFVRYNLKTGK